jgi:hypothetical protein
MLYQSVTSVKSVSICDLGSGLGYDLRRPAKLAEGLQRQSDLKARRQCHSTYYYELIVEKVIRFEE